jgi:hypothetical protein
VLASSAAAVELGVQAAWASAAATVMLKLRVEALFFRYVLSELPRLLKGAAVTAVAVTAKTGSTAWTKTEQLRRSIWGQTIYQKDLQSAAYPA